MSEKPTDASEAAPIQQVDFERITALVSSEFQIEESLIEHGVPTYYLKQPQETKQAFLKLLKSLESRSLIAVLRKTSGRIVLRIIPKPPVKPSNVMVNWILLLATIATTFVTGYLLSPGVIDPFIGGATFTVAILAVLGTHEMGHKITASRKGIEATFPYFIPGPPPFGTFGAVIMQKSLPPNKDALFDVGADGPVSGFVIAAIVSAIGLTMLIPGPHNPNATEIPSPILWTLLGRFLASFSLIPTAANGQDLFLHPVTFAGYVGLLVTMLNLLPAAMLDGGHVARSILGEKPRLILSALSIIFLLYEGVYLMAFLVLFMSLYKHPGPLDDVSSLSTGRKVFAVVLVAVFVLSWVSLPV
jgi:Zn-dependent protease